MISEFKRLERWFRNQLGALVLFICHTLNNVLRYITVQLVEKNDEIGNLSDDDQDVPANSIIMDASDGSPRHKKSPVVRRQQFKDDLKPGSKTKSGYKKKVQVNTITTTLPSPSNAEKIQHSSENAENLYKLKNPYCIVIGNINFDDQFAPRNGGDADVKNIQHLLEKTANFKTVKTYLNCKRTGVLKIIDDIAGSPEIANHDGFLCFITSHGTSEGIRTVDKKGYVTVDELTSRLNGKQCKSLRGKPKLFFIQACRGKIIDKGVPDGDITTDANLNDEMVVPKLPTEADFLVCYSTTDGYLSHRRFSIEVHKESMGSWFLYILADVFTKYMKEEDVMQMMIRVNAEVAKMATGDDHVDGQKEMPCQMHRLRAKVMMGNY